MEELSEWISYINLEGLSGSLFPQKNKLVPSIAGSTGE